MRASFALVWVVAAAMLLIVHESEAAEATLQDAIKARTEVTVLREEVGELDPDVRRPMRKVIAKGEAQQMAGNILLMKDKYEEAVAAYGKAAAFYRQALNGRKILERLAEARKKASRARMLAEAAAADALESREYTPARALFAQAEDLYRQAAALQVKRDKVVAAHKTAQDSMKLADAAFQTEARPASFERAKQCLTDGTKALEDEELDKAREFFGDAVQFFAKAQTEADLANAFDQAQNAWARTVAEADDALLTRHVARAAAAAKARAEEAEKKAREGQVEAGTELLKQATAALKDAASKALTAENAVKAAPIIARLERDIAQKKKFRAEDTLAELEKLIPADPRMAGLGRRVAAIPGLKRSLTLDLGGGVKMDLVLIRPGSFKMGSEKSDDEKPVHEVTITKPFYIGKHEVTQEQWEAAMDGNPSYFKGKTNPVERVSWTDCQGFLKKLKPKLTGLSPGLPTEAEWEYACRAGSTTAYCFGDNDKDLGDYAWYNPNSNNRTHPVGKKKPNAWGLYDMHGNLSEWCRDWYDKAYYAESPKEDPAGLATGSGRVLRGGSWRRDAAYCRSASRYDYGPANQGDSSGFRVVLRGGVD